MGVAEVEDVVDETVAPAPERGAIKFRDQILRQCRDQMNET